MAIEREYKADIIIMKEEHDNQYRFYFVDRFNDMIATQEAIDNLAERHCAKVSWFPTADPNIAKIRRLLKLAGIEKELLEKTADILERRAINNEHDKNRQD